GNRNGNGRWHRGRGLCHGRRQSFRGGGRVRMPHGRCRRTGAQDCLAGCAARRWLGTAACSVSTTALASIFTASDGLTLWRAPGMAFAVPREFEERHGPVLLG